MRASLLASAMASTLWCSRFFAASPKPEVGLPRSLRCTTSRSSAAEVGLASQEAVHEELVFDLCQNCEWIFMRYCDMPPLVSS